LPLNWEIRDTTRDDGLKTPNRGLNQGTQLLINRSDILIVPDRNLNREPRQSLGPDARDTLRGERFKILSRNLYTEPQSPENREIRND
jgi:hypothetical protein